MRAWRNDELARCQIVEQLIADAGYTMKVLPMEPGWMMQVSPTVQYVYVNEDGLKSIAPLVVIGMLECAVQYIERARLTGDHKTGNAFVENLYALR